MIDLTLPVPLMLVPVLLVVYALAFVAGGVYYLEQRVARIRDQFPKRGPIARLTGYAALSIGLLAALSIGGYALNRGAQFRVAALAATASGLAFWVTRIHIGMTAASRIRSGLLAMVCLALTVLTAWWMGLW